MRADKFTYYSDFASCLELVTLNTRGEFVPKIMETFENIRYRCNVEGLFMKLTYSEPALYSDPSLHRASPIAASLFRGIFYSAFLQ